jgi:hypothetical protein
MRQRLLCAALLLPVCAFACPKVVDTQLSHESFPSEIDARRALSAGVLGESVAPDVELAGALYRLDDRVRVSIGRGCPGADSIRFSSPIIDGEIPAAFWHTHGGAGPARDRFSPDDVRLVLDVGRPFYLITPRGDIRVLDPSRARGAARRPRSRSIVRGGPMGLDGRLVD